MEWLRKQAAPGVSSVVSQSDSERGADYADLTAWLSLTAVGRSSTGMEYARRLDARSVASGQMAEEEFRDLWNTDPYEILARQTNPPAPVPLYGGENASDVPPVRYETGTSAWGRADHPICVDEEEVPEL